MRRAINIIITAAFFLSPGVFASVAPAESTLHTLIKQELSKRYPGSRIELLGSVQWTRGSAPEQPEAVRIITEGRRAEARFSVYTAGESKSEGAVAFAAWMPARIAAKRIMPGERLSESFFIKRDINVAEGYAREYRGVILPAETDVASLEARQTILEGQYPLSTGVQRVPDVRRGDQVRIRLISGSVVLTTIGQAVEPAYIDGQVRVLTAKTKKELHGKLQESGVVEVKL